MVVRFVAGVLIGGVLAGGLFLVLDSGDETADPVPALSSTTLTGSPTEVVQVVEAPWVAADEARFESSLILPKAMSIAGDTAVLEFDLTTLGPLPVDFEGGYGPVAVRPERFLLVTNSGSIEGETSSSGTTVRFEVPKSVAVDDLIEVRLTRWRVSMPIHHVFEIELETGTTVPLPGGGAVTVANVLDQKSERIARFETQRPDDDDFATDPVVWHLRPLPDQEWTFSWSDSGFQIVREDAEAAASVWFSYDPPLWLPVDGDIVVWQGHTQ